MARSLIALVLGLLFTYVCCSFMTEVLHWSLGWPRASIMMWMLLLSFFIYAAVIMWIYSTLKFRRDMLVLFIMTAGMYALIPTLKALAGVV